MSKRVLITGAGSGLGRALANRWAAGGARVAVADINDESAAETCALIEKNGGQALQLHLDVRSDDDWQQAKVQLQQVWSGIDVLVNNAGVAGGGRLVDTSMEDWEWMLDINLKGVIRGCHTFVPDLMTQRNGHVVNIASFAGIAQVPGMISYNVAKTGVISLSETLRAELHEYGVGVTVACPSFFQTNLMDSFRGGSAGQKAWVGKVMSRAKVTAEDVASDIVDATDSGRFMVVSHAEARWHHRFKRLSPEGYFKQLVKLSKRMAPSGK